MLVSLPSKMGEVSGDDAQRPQSQYCIQDQHAGNIDVDGRGAYRLSTIVSAFFDERLFVRIGEVSVP